MTMIKMFNDEDISFNRPEYREPVGYIDNGQTVITCSNCRVPLVEIWSVLDTDAETVVRVRCPHCGDKSFAKTVKGRFWFGHTDYTNMVDMSYIPENNSVFVLTEKAMQWKNQSS